MLLWSRNWWIAPFAIHLHRFAVHEAESSHGGSLRAFHFDGTSWKEGRFELSFVQMIKHFSVHFRCHGHLQIWMSVSLARFLSYSTFIWEISFLVSFQNLPCGSTLWSGVYGAPLCSEHDPIKLNTKLVEWVNRYLAFWVWLVPFRA